MACHEAIKSIGVPVDEVSGVDVFDAGKLFTSRGLDNQTVGRATYQLIREKKNGLEGEFTVTEVE